jgi:hypothetical protein
MQPPRVSIQQLMVAIGCVACLIPFPSMAVEIILVTFDIWVFCPVMIVLYLYTRSWRRLSLALIVLMIAWATLFLAQFIVWRVPSVRSLPFFARCLTPIQLLGPIYLSFRIWRVKALMKGEILWAWSGLVWVGLLVSFDPNHAGLEAKLIYMNQVARLTLFLVLCLVVTGKGSHRLEPVWPAYLGWGLIGCDAIVWEWYSLPWMIHR